MAAILKEAGRGLPGQSIQSETPENPTKNGSQPLRDPIFVVWAITALALAALNAYMYFSANAAFSWDYRLIRILIVMFLVFVAASVHRSNKLVVILLTIAALSGSFAFRRVAFMGSLDKFLYLRNKTMFQEVVRDILERDLDGDALDAYLDARKGLPFTVVAREKEYVSVYIYTNGLSLRSRVVYTSNMKKLREDIRKTHRDHVQFETLSQNWCTLNYEAARTEESP